MSTDLDITLIQPDPANVRRHFDEASLDELAESIRAQGVIQPIVVCPAPVTADTQPGQPMYQIVAGERRWRAAQRAGLTFIPAVIREDLTPRAAAAVQMAENIHREELPLLDLAARVSQMVGELGALRTAEALKKSASYVSKLVNLHKLPAEVLHLVQAGAVASIDVAADLAKLVELGPEHELTRQSLDEAKDEKLTRAALRDRVAQLKEHVAPPLLSAQEPATAGPQKLDPGATTGSAAPEPATAPAITKAEVASQPEGGAAPVPPAVETTAEGSTETAPELTSVPSGRSPLQALVATLGGADRVSLTLTAGQAPGTYQCVFVPILAAERADMSAEAREIRQRLARPFVVKGPTETLDAQLEDFLRGQAEVRRTTEEQLEAALQREKQAKRQATPAKKPSAKKKLAKPARKPRAAPVTQSTAADPA